MPIHMRWDRRRSIGDPTRGKGRTINRGIEGWKERRCRGERFCFYCLAAMLIVTIQNYFKPGLGCTRKPTYYIFCITQPDNIIVCSTSRRFSLNMRFYSKWKIYAQAFLKANSQKYINTLSNTTHIRFTACWAQWECQATKKTLRRHIKIC